MKHEITTDIAVLYHAHCSDGFGAAWAAWKKFGDNATYVPVKYGENLPEDIDGKEVYLLDFSYDGKLLPELKERAKRLVVIDHHASAESYVTALDEYVFDLKKSGAYLTWEYFHPNTPVPQLIHYLSDADLYTYTLPNAYEIATYLHTMPQTFETYETLAANFTQPNGIERMIETGKLLMIYRDKVVEPALRSVHIIQLAGHEIPAVNMVFPQSEVSYVLHEVYEKYPSIALSYRYDDGQWKCSLRSDGSINCADIATQFGGGGHPGAAGFAIPFEEGKYPFTIVRGAADVE